MMNKRRTSEMGKAKYLLFAPLAAALLMVSNIETVAREVSKQLPGNVTMQEKSSSSSVVVNVALADSAKKAKLVEGTKKKAKSAQQSKTTQQAMATKAEQSDKKSTAAYDVVENMPQFPGGQGAFMKYVIANIKYPKSAAEAKKQGSVVVGFVIDRDGNVTEPKVMRSVDEELDAEALRVVTSSPKWIPGTQNGKPVAVKYVVPVIFKIPASKDAEQK